MTRQRMRRATGAVVAVTTAVTLSSCGLGTSGGLTTSAKLAGPLASVKKLDGLDIAVGSKDFTEQQILGKIAVIMLQSGGAKVKDFTAIPGSAASRQAQLTGQVQLIMEYTGTAWITYMGKTDPIADSRKQYEAVKAEDAKNGFTWLEPAPMNNTYSLGMRQDFAKKYGLKDLSDLKKVPVGERTFCIESEFANRNDGFQPMLKAYGMTYGKDVPTGNIRKMDTGAIYSAIDQKVCNLGEVFTTDGRIKSLHLDVMSDSKHFFPNYNVSPVVKTTIYEKYPQIARILEPVVKKLDNDTLIDLNARVDVEGKDPGKVAEQWLKREGFIE